mgnify:CR=1 FL=1
MNVQYPAIGQWFRRPEGTLFEVVATDEYSGTVEIQEFDGTIESINNRIDPVTRTVIVRALVPNPEGRLLPGMLMQVDVLRNECEAVVTAEAAMMPMADRQYVMRVIGEGDDATVEKVEVSTGLRMPGYVESLDGLSDGDLVVTHGNHKLKPGDKLNIIGIDDGTVDVATLLKKKKQAGKTTKP